MIPYFTSSEDINFILSFEGSLVFPVTVTLEKDCHILWDLLELHMKGHCQFT